MYNLRIPGALAFVHGRPLESVRKRDGSRVTSLENVINRKNHYQGNFNYLSSQLCKNN